MVFGFSDRFALGIYPHGAGMAWIALPLGYDENLRDHGDSMADPPVYHPGVESTHVHIDTGLCRPGMDDFEQYRPGGSIAGEVEEWEAKADNRVHYIQEV